MSSETSPHLPTDLIRVAMTRRISEVSLCSDLPDLDELWAAGAAPGLRCRALEAVEVRCRDLARALSDVFSGIHFVPRFGAAMALPYELYSFWEEVLANESQALMSHWKYGKKGDKNHRRELFNIEPYMILDPDEMDCTIAYMSQGLEDLFGYWRAWALGRHFRFLLLQDALWNRVFNGQEPGRIEEFCYNQGQKDQGAMDSASHMLSLLRLYSVKTKQPIWCCIYLRHVWLQDPTVFENQYDFSAKHFVLAVVLPLYTQMPALHDLLTTNDPEANLRLTISLRKLLLERTQNVELSEKEANAIVDSVIPAWLLDSGRGAPSCMVGQHFVPRVGLAPVRDFQGLWPHLVRLLFRLKNPPREEMMRPTLLDQEEGLACWVADVRSRDLPLVFLSHALQKLTGFLADFALARNVQLFQPKKQRIDQAINNEEQMRLQEFSTQNRSHGDVMASLLLLECQSGKRFFAVQQTFYLKEPRTDRAYLLSVLHLIELSMPAVLKSHQITELNEDEMGMALDEWGVFLVQEREDSVGKPLMLSDPLKACEYYSAHFAAFLRTGEDYVGDLFVPKIGLVEVHAFKGVLESLLEVLRSDLQRVLQDDQAEGKMDQVIMTVVDPEGEDYPLVWISPGFEDYTGFQREWVLGRNCRFLQPKDFERNQQFNGDQLEHLRVFCAQARKFSMPSASNTFALLLNERRNGSPFWNLSSFHHLEVNEKRYIVSVMLPF
ncbi:Blue-light-activated histidine kinase 1 (EL360-LOV-histidine kinase) (EL360-LOV-HK), partial [Durusdinium trenchii]